MHGVGVPEGASFIAMSTHIPITGFALEERVPVEVIQRQAGSLVETPLTALLLNSATNYVFILNEQRQIVFASDSAASLATEGGRGGVLGLRVGEAVGCVHAQESPLGCGCAEACTQCGVMLTILAGLGGRPERQECRMTRLINCRHRALDLLVAATPFVHQGERFTMLSVADIGHEKRRRTLERVLFHDVLNGAEELDGMMERLKAEAPAGMESVIEVARIDFENLIGQIQSQRDLLAAERDELTVIPESVQTRDLLAQLIQFYGKNDLARERSLRLDSIAVEIEVVTDRALLKRVLGDLIKNALEATNSGDVVTAGCGLAEGRARFWVHNPGSMPPEVQLQVFNRSFSTKGTGRGLGTYSVRLLAERYLQGRVVFWSSSRDGTTFEVTLPLRLTPN